jgi:hypothetical protein
MVKSAPISAVMATNCRICILSPPTLHDRRRSPEQIHRPDD